MTQTDHLAKARDYIAKGDDFYDKAAKEIVAAIEEDGYSQREVARQLGRDHSWVQRLVKWHNGGAPAHQSPFGGEQENQRKDMSQARTALRDPTQRRQVIESLDPQEVEGLVEQATEIAVGRARAKRAEHQTDPTVRDLMGDDKFDPAEFWADTLIIRVNRNARELAHLIKRGGGLLFGTMPPGEAFEYLNEAERLIADARAAAQELARDQVEV